MNFPTIPAFPQVSALKLALLAGYGIAAFGAGYYVRDLAADRYAAKIEAQQAKASEKAVRLERDLEAKGQEVSQALRDQHDTKQEAIRVQTRTILNAIPIYVPAPEGGPEGAEPWNVPLGAVRLHDYAALGLDPPLPAPSGEPVGAASGIELPAFVGTVGSNYGVCRGWREEVTTWREWYARQAGAWVN